MWTFTKHEQPQRLADIMREAWAIRRTTGAGFGPSLRQAWANARESAGRRLPPQPPTLLQFLRRRGGLRPDGELRHIGAPLHILNRNGLPLDLAARLATDAGYPIHDDAAALLDAIHDETLGRTHLAAGDEAIADELAAWADQHAILMDTAHPHHPDNRVPF